MLIRWVQCNSKLNPHPKWAEHDERGGNRKMLTHKARDCRRKGSEWRNGKEPFWAGKYHFGQERNHSAICYPFGGNLPKCAE